MKFPKFKPLIKTHKVLGTKRILVLIAFLIVFFSITRGGADLDKIQTVPAQKKTIQSTVIASGNINSRETSNLRFPTSGKIAWLNIQKGNYVRRGQILASLDSRELEKRLQEQLSLYLKTRLDFDEIKDSQEDKIITDSLKRIAQKAQIDLDNSVIEVEIKNLALENAKLVSPIDGYILEKPTVFAGSYVLPTDTISKVGNLGKLQFIAEVDETDIGEVKINQKAQISLEALGTKIIEEDVDLIAPAAITTTTGGTAFEVVFDLSSDNNMRIGMNGEAKVIIDQVQDTIVISNNAIIDDNFIWIKTGTKFEKRSIVRGLLSDLETQIISGLRENELVVTSGFEEINKRSILQKIIAKFK